MHLVIDAFWWMENLQLDITVVLMLDNDLIRKKMSSLTVKILENLGYQFQPKRNRGDSFLFSKYLENI